MIKKALSVIVPGRREGIDDPAVGPGNSGMGDMGGDDVHTAGCEQEFLPADDHFQFSFNDISDLFMYVMMLRRDTALFYFPDDQGAGIAMDHFSGESGQGLPGWNIIKVLHGVLFHRKYVKTGFLVFRS
jgi:hypothetical protein